MISCLCLYWFDIVYSSLDYFCMQNQSCMQLGSPLAHFWHLMPLLWITGMGDSLKRCTRLSGRSSLYLYGSSVRINIISFCLDIFHVLQMYVLQSMVVEVLEPPEYLYWILSHFLWYGEEVHGVQGFLQWSSSAKATMKTTTESALDIFNIVQTLALVVHNMTRYQFYWGVRHFDSFTYWNFSLSSWWYIIGACDYFCVLELCQEFLF